jgi:hypothetical protein
MISTVTTSTVTTVATFALGAIPGGLLVLALIVLLVKRELATAAGPCLGSLARNLTVAIAPMLVAFTAICISRLAALL